MQALQDTLRQVQEIRTYYDFPDIDIDRYEIDGTLREVMLAVRELNVDKLPESSHNWINDKLIYTHGYGITMNPVNGFTPEGLPTLHALSNMPVQSTVPGLNVTRPEIYFGEMTNTDVYVKTHQQEFNYPEGQNNNLTSYSGTGGIVLGGFLRRVLHRLRSRRPDQAPLQRRHHAQQPPADAPQYTRARGGAGAVPHLRPATPTSWWATMAASHWIIDAFTSSDTYPYSARRPALNGEPINYMRNSVKVVIDAYDGTTTFYVFDSADPILAAWRGIFPDLFKDASADAGLAAQARALSRAAAQPAGARSTASIT